MARLPAPFPDVLLVSIAALSIKNAKNHKNSALKMNFKTISSAVAWLLALAGCWAPGSPAWAMPVVVSLNVDPSVLNVGQSPAAAVLELSKRFAEAPRKSMQLPSALNPQAGTAEVSLPVPVVYGAEGRSGDSSEPVAGTYTSSHELSDWQEQTRASQGLTGGAFVEIVGSSDVKAALLDLRVEMKKFVGGTVFETESLDMPGLSQARPAENNSPNGDSTRISGPQTTAAEREMDSLRASMMFWQLVDEVKPWVFAAVFICWGCLGIRGYLRMQARRRIGVLQSRSRRHRRQTARTAAPTKTTSGSRGVL